MSQLTRNQVRAIRDAHPGPGKGGIPWCRRCQTWAPCEQRQLALGWLAAHRARRVEDKGQVK